MIVYPYSCWRACCLQCRHWQSQFEESSQQLQVLSTASQDQESELAEKNILIETLTARILTETKCNQSLNTEKEGIRKDFEKTASELRENVGKLSAENDVLKGEISAHLRVKASSHSKLEQLRKKLGMTTQETKCISQVK